MTVMVSSHLLSEIDQMATHTGIIHKGELIFQDSLEHLHEHSRKRLLLKTGNNEAALRILGELGCRPRRQSQPLFHSQRIRPRLFILLFFHTDSF